MKLSYKINVEKKQKTMEDLDNRKARTKFITESSFQSNDIRKVAYDVAKSRKKKD